MTPRQRVRHIGGLTCLFAGIATVLTIPIWVTALRDHSTIHENREPAVQYARQIIAQTDPLLQKALQGEARLQKTDGEDQGCNRGSYLFDKAQWQDAERICKAVGSISYIIPHGAPGDEKQQSDAAIAVNSAVNKAFEAAGFTYDNGGAYKVGAYQPKNLAMVHDHSIPAEVYLTVESGEQHNKRLFVSDAQRVDPDALLVTEEVELTYFQRGGGTVQPHQPGDN